MSKKIESGKDKIKTKEKKTKNDITTVVDYESIVRSMNDIVFIFDKDCRYKKIPQTSSVGLLYLPTESLIGKKITEVFPKDKAQLFNKAIKKVIKEKKPETIEYGLDINNKEHWFTADITPYKDNQALYVARDITDIKETKNILTENELKYKTLFNNANDAIFLMKDDKFIDCNEGTLKMFGCSKEKLINQSPYRFSPQFQPDGQKSEAKALKRINKALKEGSLFFEWTHLRYNGTPFEAEISLTRIEFSGQVYLQAIVRDVSERKKSEENLRKNEKELRLIWDNSADGMRITDKNGIIIRVNNAFCKMVDLKKDQIEGKPLGVIYPEERLSHIIKTHKKRFLQRDVKTYIEREQELWNGKKVWFGVSNSFFSINNKETYLLALFRNITEQKKSEKQIKETLSLLNATLDSTADGILVVDHNKKIANYNSRFVEMWDLPKDIYQQDNDLVMLNYVQIKLKDPKKFLELTKSVYKNPAKESFDVIEFKDGKIFERYSIPQKLNDQIVGRVWSFRDVTEKVRSHLIQETLYRISEAVNSTRDLDKLYEEIHSAIKNLMPANNFYIALHDKKSNRISFPYFVDEHDAPPGKKDFGNGLTEYTITKGEDILISAQMDLELRKKGFVDLAGAPAAIWLGIILKLNKIPIGVMVLQDYKNEFAYSEKEKNALSFVSEQIAQAIEKKRHADELVSYTKELQKNKELLEEKANELSNLNKELAESESKLKEINLSKDKLFSIIAHDLRSPFQPLLSISELLSDEINTLSKDEIVNFSQEIYKILKKQYSLLVNLLEWSRIQTGRIEYHPTKVNLNEIAEDVINILKVNAIKKQIIVNNKIKNEQFVSADSNMLQSILSNLISNAIKFSYPDGVINISSKEKEDEIIVSVEDNGVGISEENKQKLFKVDGQFTTAGTSQEQGTGLGLLLCKELIEKHSGRIWIESKENHFTKINFSLKRN